MAKTYQKNPAIKIGNKIACAIIRLNIAPKGMYILSVKGRKTGNIYSTPVSLIEEATKRWLVSPYGEVEWVKNARQSGYITIRRGQKSEKVRIIETSPKESAPILKKYIARESITRPYFNAGPNSNLKAFEAEASSHPVFILQHFEG